LNDSVLVASTNVIEDVDSASLTDELRSKRSPVQIGAGAPHFNDLQTESELNSSAELLPADDSVHLNSIFVRGGY
jgi:hypothetical protein